MEPELEYLQGKMMNRQEIIDKRNNIPNLIHHVEVSLTLLEQSLEQLKDTWESYDGLLSEYETKYGKEDIN